MKYLLTLLWALLTTVTALAAPAQIDTPPANSEIPRRGQVFNFTPVPNASRYLAYIGTTEGARDIETIYLDAQSSSFKVADVPFAHERLYIRLWSLIDNSWSSSSYVYNVKKRTYYPQLDGALNSHSAQLWGRSWSNAITYTESDGGIACDNEQASTVSTCTFTMNLNLRQDEEYQRVIGAFSEGAVAALINVKLKAWALAENGYCQIALKAAQEAEQLEASDFLAHVEVFGDKNWKLAGRKITYVAIPFNLNKNGDFTIKINKEIIGDCEVSIAFNVLGIYK